MSADADLEYAKVPADFPRPGHNAAVAGFQPKLALTEYGGRYYPAGATPAEVWSRWDVCEDLAQQMVDKSRESKAGKRREMAERDILDQYLTRLLETGWVSAAEGRWVMRRAAGILEWPAPEAALEPPEGRETG